MPRCPRSRCGRRSRRSRPRSSAHTSQVVNRRPSLPMEAVTQEAPPWHAEEEDAVLRRLNARADGLTSEEAGLRAARYGPNQLPVSEGPSALSLLLGQLK